MARHRKRHANPGSRGANDDDFVGVFRRRDLSVQHVIKRVDGKRRPTITVFVKLWQHQCRLISLDAQFADLHRLSGVELDIVRRQIKALDCRQQRHGGHGIAIVINQQRLLAHCTVYILVLVQVSDAGCRHANTLDWLLATDCRVGKPAFFANGTFKRVSRQRFVRVALGLTEHENRGHQHVAGLRHAGRQHRVRIKRPFGIGNDFVQLGVAGCLVRASIAGPQHALDLANECEACINLGLEKKYRVDNRLGLRSRKLVDQLCVDIAWPGPTTDIGNALVIDGNDGNPVGRLARCAGAGNVIKPALQRTDQVRGLVEKHHRQHNQNTCDPISTPQLRSFQ